MKPRAGYIKTTINGCSYLLPYGQNIADHRPGIRLNESGALLWDAICEGADREGLLAILSEHYAPVPSDPSRLHKDLDEYLEHLSRNGLLEFETVPPSPASPKQFYFQIGPVKIALTGPKPLFDTYFKAFSCEPGEADLTVNFSFGMPLFRCNGEILVRSETILICADADDYILLYPNSFPLLEIHIKKDGSAARIYCMPSFDDTLYQSAYHAIRFAFLILAQRHELYVLHSASILYRGAAWLFSGKSGAGKSTHAALWKEHFNTPILNGDLNLIGMEQGVPTVYGLPWCGTSGIYSTCKVPLGGIVLLKQDSHNQIVQLSIEDQALFVMQRMISPSWIPAQMKQNLAFAEKLAEKTSVFRLFCTKDLDAAKLLKHTIDELNERVKEPEQDV